MATARSWNSQQAVPLSAPKVDPVTGLGNAAMFKHENPQSDSPLSPHRRTL